MKNRGAARVEERDEVTRKLVEMAKNAEVGRHYTRGEIGDYVGVSREAIRKIESEALKKMRVRMGKIIKEDGINKEDLFGKEKEDDYILF